MESIFFQLAEQLTPEEIVRVCSINKQFQQLCENEDLWQNLYLRRFGPLSHSPISWKYEYAIRTTSQKVFEFMDEKFYEIILPDNLDTIKQITFSDVSRYNFLLTWDGKVYKQSQTTWNSQDLWIDHQFKLHDVFPNPIDYMATDGKSVILVDKQENAYIMQNEWPTSSIKPFSLPQNNDQLRTIRKIWVTTGPVNQLGDRANLSYYILSSDDQVYRYYSPGFYHVTALSNQNIQELGSQSGRIYVITPTRFFYYSELSYLNDPDPGIADKLKDRVILADNNLLLTDNHQAFRFWTERSVMTWTIPDPILWKDSVRKLVGNSVLTESGDLYHYTEGQSGNKSPGPPQLLPIPDFKVVNIFKVRDGKKQVVVLAMPIIPISQSIYEKLLEHDQIDWLSQNETGKLLARDVRGHLLQIS